MVSYVNVSFLEEVIALFSVLFFHSSQATRTFNVLPQHMAALILFSYHPFSACCVVTIYKDITHHLTISKNVSVDAPLYSIGIFMGAVAW